MSTRSGTKNSKSLLLVSDYMLCPIQMYKLYISKLNPNCKYLWQRPKKKSLTFHSAIWFDNQCLGGDTIRKFMPTLSENAKLSTRYTNHCICKTCIVTLDKNGFEACHIMAVSSHKSESTIKEYAEECPENKRKEMFDALSKTIIPPKVPKIAPTSTVSKPQKRKFCGAIE